MDYTVTLTNLHGSAKAQILRAIQALDINYSPNLNIGTSNNDTTHLVCGDAETMSTKMKAALSVHMPICSHLWLLESLQARTMLSHEPYDLFSAATTSRESRKMSMGSPEVLRAAPSPRPPSTEKSVTMTSKSPTPQLQQKALHFVLSFDEIQQVPFSPTSADKGSKAKDSSELEDLERQLGSTMLSDEEHDLLCPSPAAMHNQPRAVVILGKEQDTPPTKATLKVLAAHHQDANMSTVKFFSRATLKSLPESDLEIFIDSGDFSHGVQMLYDVVDGKKVHARAVVKSIYQLKGDDQVWMEHHYLFAEDDFAERPAWQQALTQPLQQGELILSSSTYCSPLSLVESEFGVLFPTVASAHNKGGVIFPLFLCRRAFDPVLVKQKQLKV